MRSTVSEIASETTVPGDEERQRGGEVDQGQAPGAGLLLLRDHHGQRRDHQQAVEHAQIAEFAEQRRLPAGHDVGKNAAHAQVRTGRWRWPETRNGSRTPPRRCASATAPAAASPAWSAPRPDRGAARGWRDVKKRANLILECIMMPVEHVGAELARVWMRPSPAAASAKRRAAAGVSRRLVAEATAGTPDRIRLEQSPAIRAGGAGRCWWIYGRDRTRR